MSLGFRRLLFDGRHGVRAGIVLQHGAGDGAGQLRQYRLQAAYHRLEQVDAFAQGAVDVCFHRAFVVQVDDANVRMLLAEAVYAANALLHAHGVPRHVVVHQRTAELEVQAFGGGIGAEQHVRFALAEAAFGVVAADASPCAIGRRHFAAAAREAHQAGAGVLAQGVAQEVHGVGELGEHHRLLVAALAQFGQHGLETGELAVWRQGAGAFQQGVDLRTLVGSQCGVCHAFEFVGIELLVGFVFWRILLGR